MPTIKKSRINNTTSNSYADTDLAESVEYFRGWHYHLLQNGKPEYNNNQNIIENLKVTKNTNDKQIFLLATWDGNWLISNTACIQPN